MEDLFKDKLYKNIFIFFIVISIVHIIYATVTFRGMYMDGASYMLSLLNNLGNRELKFVIDNSHPRFFMMALTQIPMMISAGFLFIKSKTILMLIYCFTQFFLPFGALLYNFYLTKRTGRTDVLFWNLFTYGTVLCLYMIYSCVESFTGITFNFILWNYLVSDMEYKKRDIAVIIFLVLMMFGTYEYIIFLGPLLFFFHFNYLHNGISVKNTLIKVFIASGGLLASIFNLIFMLRIPGETSEIARFFGEATIIFPYLMRLNSLFSITTVILLFIFLFYKKKINFVGLSAIIISFCTAFLYLISTADFSINPMLEGHFRTVPCYFVVLIFVIMYLIDCRKNKIPKSNCKNNVLLYNSFCIVTFCCIFQMFWQIGDTYFWDKNIKYMKSELAKCDDLLYIPSEHEKISSFLNKDYRRYIWHSVYAPTSILFSDNYKQKTLLMNYDTEYEKGNLTFRELLFVPEINNKISVPLGIHINIKNRYWDLTDCAEALRKYNIDNNIKTLK